MSLEHFLIKKFGKGNVIRPLPELAWSKDGLQRYNELYSDYTPIFMTREPSDRLWSAWNYFPELHKMTFEELVNGRHPKHQWLGCKQPLYQSNYHIYTRNYKDAILLELEEMKKNPLFPKLNTTKELIEMPKKFRDLVE